jgi:type IV pilus assembly protein PilE
MRHRAERIGRLRIAGFSLTELMTVVVIVGILSSIAIPNYRRYMLRTHRTAAKTALLAIATSQERYYLEFHTYGTISQLDLRGYPTTSENALYTITMETADAVTYTAKATAAVGTNGVDMTKDTQCSWFQITAAGTRTASGGTECW